MLRTGNATAAVVSSSTRADSGCDGGLDVGELADVIADAAKGLRYGSIEVVVHDARVVQVVRTEKRRMFR